MQWWLNTAFNDKQCRHLSYDLFGYQKVEPKLFPRCLGLLNRPSTYSTSQNRHASKLTPPSLIKFSHARGMLGNRRRVFLWDSSASIFAKEEILIFYPSPISRKISQSRFSLFEMISDSEGGDWNFISTCVSFLPTFSLVTNVNYKEILCFFLTSRESIELPNMP